ncbi:MAG TPA: hypothetical protein VFA12_20420 [Stellaceae bacterium]|nr:hypothetical protein [Stellaceae bacterium]
MTDKRIRIVAGAPLKAALRATAGEEYPTGRVNSIAERYLDIVEEARPAFARAEWCAVCDANNGAGSFDELEIAGAPEWMVLAANVADTPGLGAKWDIDQRDLVRRLDGLPRAGKIAVLETAQRFWALTELPTEEALDLATSHPATWPEIDR